MGVNRANLKIGPCNVQIGAGPVIGHTREAVKPRFVQNRTPVEATLFGKIDQSIVDRWVDIPFRLWGAWQDIATFFPTSYLNPTIGARIYGDADVAIKLHGRDGERITFHNAQMIRMSNLHLGVDAPLFAADVLYRALIKNNANPEDAAAYYTIDSAAFADATFAKTNYKQQRYAGAWAGKTGLTSYAAKEGWDIEWDLDTEPLNINGYGTVDMTLQGLTARLKCIPVETSLANLDAAAAFQLYALGVLLSAGAADHTISGSGVSVVLKNAGIVEHGAVFGGKELRNGETMWETTRGFAAGVAAALATVT